MRSTNSWIGGILSVIVASGCGGAATASSGGSDVSVDSGPIGITATGIAAPTQFTCTSASKNAAGFSWQASSASGVSGYVVERAPLGGDFAAQPAVDGKTLTFADLTVAQAETYHYRVRAKVADTLGDSSNEVTIGAPPPGFHTAASGTGVGFGSSVDFALDGNGDPAVIYLADKVLQFVGWDRKTAAWKPPVKVTSSLSIGGAGSNSAALAFDHAGSSGTFAVVWASADGQEIAWALSSDAGKTWQEEAIAVSPANTTFSQPTVALGNSKAHIAWLQDGSRLFYATGTLSTPAKNWTVDKEAPPAVKADKILPLPPAIALDAAQQPAIAYFSHANDGGVIATFWRPGDKSATSIMDSQGYADSAASLGLAFKNASPRAAVTLHKSATTAAPVWFVTSADGNSWGTPQVLPVDNPQSGGLYTRLATSSKDVSAITWASTTPAGGLCGEPKLALSPEGKLWATCSPDTDKARGGTAEYSRIALASDGKRWMAWQDVSAGQVVVWREP